MEVWKPVVGVDGYEISNLGRVKSIDRVIHHQGDKRVRRLRGVMLKMSKNLGGYFFVNLGSQRLNATIHKMVAEAFLGPAFGRDVHHKNGIKTDNRLENLQYLTRLQHFQEESRLGTRRGARGNSHFKTKIKDEDIEKVFQMRAEGMKLMDIAKAMGVKSHNTIRRILSGDRRVAPSA
jgi:hypothetical protein